MAVSDASPTTNKALFSVFPIVTLALVSSTLLLSLWCDANNATDGAIRGRNNKNNNNNANGVSSSASKKTQDSNVAIYHQLGVKPPHNTSKVVKLGFGMELPLYRWAWKLHGRLLPLLHGFENERPQDLFVNLKVLWCKLLISLDPDSPAYEGKRTTTNDKEEDGQLCNHYYATYQMLPPYSIKWALRYLGLWKVFPRWMHANIELRMVYLQTALEKVLGSQLPKQDAVYGSENICVIILGGGYDPWGTKLSASGKHSSTNSTTTGRANRIQRVYELDLPKVVDSKRRLLLRAGFDVVHDCKDCNQGGDGSNQQEHGVRLEGVDLNNDIGVDRVLDKIRDELIAISELRNSHKTVNSNASTITNDSIPPNGRIQWHVVLISEALLLYLDPGKAERILEGVAERFCGNTCNDQCSFRGASFVFADRLMRRKTTAKSIAAAARRARMSLPASPEEIQSEKLEVQRWLRDRGWELNEVLLKSGATRHLGIATTISPQ